MPTQLQRAAFKPARYHFKMMLQSSMLQPSKQASIIVLRRIGLRPFSLEKLTQQEIESICGSD